jgi:hypothetical protein
VRPAHGTLLLERCAHAEQHEVGIHTTDLRLQRTLTSFIEVARGDQGEVDVRARCAHRGGEAFGFTRTASDQPDPEAGIGGQTDDLAHDIGDVDALREWCTEHARRPHDRLTVSDPSIDAAQEVVELSGRRGEVDGGSVDVGHDLARRTQLAAFDEPLAEVVPVERIDPDTEDVQRRDVARLGGDSMPPVLIELLHASQSTIDRAAARSCWSSISTHPVDGTETAV